MGKYTEGAGCAKSRGGRPPRGRGRPASRLHKAQPPLPDPSPPTPGASPPRRWHHSGTTTTGQAEADAALPEAEHARPQRLTGDTGCRQGGRGYRDEEWKEGGRERRGGGEAMVRTMPEGPCTARHATPAAGGTLLHPTKTGGTGGREAGNTATARYRKGSRHAHTGVGVATIGEAAHSRVWRQGVCWEGGWKTRTADLVVVGGGREGVGALRHHQTGWMGTKQRHTTRRGPTTW